MSELKSKSSQNITSALILINNNQFSSSIHCSYYACVQLMLHILRADFNKSEQDITDESQTGSQDEGGFHNWLINFIRGQFFLRNNVDCRDFHSFITQLKGKRIKSDYKNKEIKPNEAREAYDYTQRIIKLLEKNFTV